MEPEARRSAGFAAHPDHQQAPQRAAPEQADARSDAVSASEARPPTPPDEREAADATAKALPPDAEADWPTVIRQPAIVRAEQPPPWEPSAPPEPAASDDPSDGSAGEDAPAAKRGARALVSGTGWQTLQQVLPLVVNIVLTPYVIHGVGQEVYGIFLLVMSVQVFLGSIDGGIGPSAGRYFAIYAGRGDAIATTRLLCTLQIVAGVLSVIFLGVVFAAAPAIVAFFPVTNAEPAGSVILLRTMLAISAVAQVRGLLAQVLFAHHNFVVSSTANLLGSVVYTIGLIVTVENGFGLVGFAWTFIAQQILATVIIVPSALRLLTPAGIGLVDRALLKEFFQYAWKVQVSGFLTIVSEAGDNMLVGKFAARDMVAFGTGASFANTVGKIPMNAAFPIQTHIGQKVGAVGAKDAAENIDKLERIWLILVVGWVAVGAPAVFFGVNAWLNLGTILPGIVACLLLVSRGAHLFVFVHTQWANTLGRSEVAMISSVINVILNLGITFAVIGTFGALGSVAATVFASIVAGILVIILSKRALPAQLGNPLAKVRWSVAFLCSALTFLFASSIDRFLVGTVIPEGPLALIAIGLPAAPILVLYVIMALGLTRTREVLTRIKNRG